MTSLYELTNSWEKPARIRLVENFTGNELNTNRWTKNNDVGTNTFAMADEVDGGFKITTEVSGSNDNGRISFGGNIQFNPFGCVMLATIKAGQSTSGWRVRCGLSESWTNNRNSAYTNIASDSVGGKIGLFVIEHTTLTQTATSVSTSTNWVDTKLELKPATTQLSINGILEATTNATATGSDTDHAEKLEPNFYVLDMGYGASVGQIRYMECYDT